MKTALKPIMLWCWMPVCLAAQETEDWPPLAYLKSDYKAVHAVAHIRIREAEITSRIIGKENWRVRCEVLESLKGRFRRGDVIEYFHGAEAGFPKKYFTGEKIVFLLAEFDKTTKRVEAYRIRQLNADAYAGAFEKTKGNKKVFYQETHAALDVA
jgi:hypothetical protein